MHFKPNWFSQAWHQQLQSSVLQQQVASLSGDCGLLLLCFDHCSAAEPNNSSAWAHKPMAEHFLSRVYGRDQNFWSSYYKSFWSWSTKQHRTIVTLAPCLTVSIIFFFLNAVFVWHQRYCDAHHLKCLIFASSFHRISSQKSSASLRCFI